MFKLKKGGGGWTLAPGRPGPLEANQVIPSTNKSPCHTGSPDSGVELFVCIDRPQIGSLVTISHDATFLHIFRALLLSEIPAILLIQAIFCL